MLKLSHFGKCKYFDLFAITTVSIQYSLSKYKLVPTKYRFRCTIFSLDLI